MGSKISNRVIVRDEKEEQLPMIVVTQWFQLHQVVEVDWLMLASVVAAAWG